MTAAFAAARPNHLPRQPCLRRSQHQRQIQENVDGTNPHNYLNWHSLQHSLQHSLHHSLHHCVHRRLHHQPQTRSTRSTQSAQNDALLPVRPATGAVLKTTKVLRAKTPLRVSRCMQTFQKQSRQDDEAVACAPEMVSRLRAPWVQWPNLARPRPRPWRQVAVCVQRGLLLRAVPPRLVVMAARAVRPSSQVPTVTTEQRRQTKIQLNGAAITPQATKRRAILCMPSWQDRGKGTGRCRCRGTGRCSCRGTGRCSCRGTGTGR